MAVIDVKLIGSGQTGSVKRGLEREWTAVYRVQTSSTFDGAATVATQMGVNIGDSYAVGNDFDTNAFLREITPTRVEGSRFLWIVTCKYKTPDQKNDNQEKPDDNGDPTMDPLSWRTEIEYSSQQRSRPVEICKNITALPNRPVNTDGPLTNSAGVVFVPGWEIDTCQQLLRITKNNDQFPDLELENFVDTINKAKITWAFPANLTLVINEFCGRMMALSGSLQIENGVTFWKITREFLIDNVYGWRQNVLDRGTQRKGEGGDPDGHGGTIDLLDLHPGMPNTEAICDRNGMPISFPVHLDGNGQPLAPGAPPVYITYAVYPETDWTTIDLP